MRQNPLCHVACGLAIQQEAYRGVDTHRYSQAVTA